MVRQAHHERHPAHLFSLSVATILGMIVGRLPDVGQPTRCDVFRQLRDLGGKRPFPFTEPAMTKEGFRVRVTIEYSGYPQIRLLSRCLV
jgi:hypothetical protein